METREVKNDDGEVIGHRTTTNLADRECWYDLFAKAKAAGIKAGDDAIPTPMVVGEAKNLLSDEIDETKPTYYVAEGPCGFAWVIVKPGTSKFARYLKKHGHAKHDPYYGGVTIWIHEHGQSIARKKTHANTLAKFLRDNGIDNAWSYSRMD